MLLSATREKINLIGCYSNDWKEWPAAKGKSCLQILVDELATQKEGKKYINLERLAIVRFQGKIERERESFPPAKRPLQESLNPYQRFDACMSGFKSSPPSRFPFTSNDVWIYTLILWEPIKRHSIPFAVVLFGILQMKYYVFLLSSFRLRPQTHTHTELSVPVWTHSKHILCTNGEDSDNTFGSL